jgi:alkanesulfonate monooxygenase SsuD/methylene tetrahydromethanopterin reductase-like flavin-dependent oxidoreductase (luciferase family)
MKFSLGLVTAMPLEESIGLAKTAEKANYHRVWLGEDIFHRELFTYLSVLSLNTEKIGLASGITSPYVRNQFILASSGLALSRLSQDRFVYGLGVGGLPELGKLIGGKPKKPVEVLQKTVRYLQKKLSVEVYLGVRGPRMLGLAGRVADGVLLSGPKAYVQKAIQIIDDSAPAGKRVKKVLWNAFYLGENRELVSRITRVMLESMPEFALQNMDLNRAYEELCFSGSKEGILDEIETYEGMGVDEFVIGPPFGKNPTAVLEDMV